MASRDKQSREGTTFNYRSATFCELVLHHSPFTLTLSSSFGHPTPFFFPPSRVIVLSKEDSITKILLCNIYAVWWSRGLHLPSPLGDFCYLLLSYTLVVFCLILLFLTIFSIPNSISLFPIVWTNDSNALTKEIASKGNFNFYQPRYFNSPELEWFLSSLVWVLISLAANLVGHSFSLMLKMHAFMGIFRKKSIWSNHRGLLHRESVIRCAIFAKQHCMGLSSPLGQGLASSMIQYWGLACIVVSQGSFWILTHIGPRGKYCRFSTSTTLSLRMMIREVFMSWKLTSINSFIPRIWENCDICRALRWHDPKMVLAYLKESMYWIFLRRLVCWRLDLLRQGGVYSSIFHIGRLFLELWS